MTAPARPTPADLVAGRVDGQPAPAAPTGAQGAPARTAPNREQALRTGALARRADPALMTPEARLAELGAILATGHRRLSLSLDEKRDSEAQCDQ